MFDYLKEHYPSIDYDFSEEIKKLEMAKRVNDVLGVEGGVAYKYWNEFSKIVPEKYELESRINQSGRAMGAEDMVNVMLNYGYALLEQRIIELEKPQSTAINRTRKTRWARGDSNTRPLPCEGG
jgi:CRISPR/Cas system-associated endonuclease Cas1